MYLIRSTGIGEKDSWFLAVVPRDWKLNESTLFLLRNNGVIAPVQSTKTKTGGIFRSSTHGRMIDIDRIDFAFIRTWLKDAIQDVPNLDGYDQQLPSVGIELIQVHTRTIIAQPDSKPPFVCLSYVWGQSDWKKRESVQKGHLRYLPSKCSQTIEDAVVVTKELGYEYLWVDQYCVSKDPSIRHSQIATMDVVYKSASMTIVAATGSDADYGLPGVSRPRKPQPHCLTEAGGLVCVRLDALHDMDASVYASRAWTYQERLFSNHCLVFTDHQVFIDSPTSMRLETLSTPVQWKVQSDLHRGERHLQLDSLRDKVLEDFSINGNTGWRDARLPWELSSTSSRLYSEPEYLVIFQRHVEQYTSRRLTYDFDALNAIAAILERFEDGECPIHSIFGIPYLLSERPILGFGLSWVHSDSKQSPKRRPEFPSWSWAGWSKEVCWFKSDNPFHGDESSGYFSADSEYVIPELDCNCGLRKSSPILQASTRFAIQGPSSLINIRSDRLQHIPATSPNAHVLIITGSFFPVEFEPHHPRDGKNSGMYLKAGLKYDPPFHARLHQLHFEHGLEIGFAQQTTGRLLAVKLAEKHRLRRLVHAPCETHLLVIAEPGLESHNTERVGMLKVPLSWYEQQNFSEQTFRVG
jgi:hypothetical protein